MLQKLPAAEAPADDEHRNPLRPRQLQTLRLQKLQAACRRSEISDFEQELMMTTRRADALPLAGMAGCQLIERKESSDESIWCMDNYDCLWRDHSHSKSPGFCHEVW
jgi:hypothetical protein